MADIDISPKPTKPPARARKAEEAPISTLLFGTSNSGKTRTIAELLMRGEYIFMLHCGLGGPGTKTIREYLATRVSGPAKVQSIMDEQFRWFKPRDVEDLQEFSEEGLPWIKGALADDDFCDKLSVLVIEEFNSAQSMYERSLTPTEGRIPRQSMTKKADKDAGSSGAYAHYGDLKMGTEYFIDGIFQIPLKQVWTCHESHNVQAINKAGDLGPWLQTKAVLGLVGAVTYSVRTFHKPVGYGKYTYLYQFAESPYNKAQIEGCPTEMPAEPAKLWDLLDPK